MEKTISSRRRLCRPGRAVSKANQGRMSIQAAAGAQNDRDRPSKGCLAIAAAILLYNITNSARMGDLRGRTMAKLKCPISTTLWRSISIPMPRSPAACTATTATTISRRRWRPISSRRTNIRRRSLKLPPTIVPRTSLSVATHKPNVYIDLSGWSPKYFPPILVRYINSILQDKMLFGSDWPVITPDRWLADFARLEIRDEIRPKC
jgi:hypothetical protein